MIFNFWSVLLVASASQSVFLIFLLLTRPGANARAKKLLIALLGVLLLITLSNLVYAGRIYYTYPGLSGLGRGMPLLIGPLIYLYTRAIMDKVFRYHWSQWLHALPYVFAVLFLFIGGPSHPNTEELIGLIDSFLSEGVPADTASIIRLSSYVVQLLIYIFITRRLVRKTSGLDDLLISADRRKKWIITVNMLLVAVCLVMATWATTTLVTGRFGYQANFALTIICSVFIYMTAYRAVANAKELFPDFNKRYGSINLAEDKKRKLLPDLLALFTEDKVILNADLKLANVAARLDTPPHVLTSLINRELGKTFFELLNEYRVKEFIAKASNPDYSHLSIMGIAQEVGYKSKSSFNTAFKKQTGKTPSEYLKNDH